MEFFTNYPYRYYFKAILRFSQRILKPFSAPPRIALFLTDKTSQLLLKTTHKIVHWDPFLHDVEGSPTIRITDPHADLTTDKSSSYHRTVYSPFQLNQDNPLTIIVDDSNVCFVRVSTIKQGFKTIGDILELLQRNPVQLIPTWKLFNTTDTYIWEVLSTRLVTLSPETPVGPEYSQLLVCGYPEHRAYALANWAQENEQHLLRIVPANTAIWLWASHTAPNLEFILITQTANEASWAYFKNGQIHFCQIKASGGVIESQTISEIESYIRETLQQTPDNIPVWCWGLSPGDPSYNKIRSQFKQHNFLITASLRQIQPIAEPENKASDRELWLLNHLI